ncbi:LLM class flavin-dependent oxidoreductase [[Kitasatospora] papulosa]|uniref:LLM class flavin-dependent oxidoreductase n=1 Tax=Streptomyces TaxID=1883 RepID=UPI0019286EDD
MGNQGNSPFAWTLLGAIAARSDRIGSATGVTCPTVRYHPAIIAQAAATMALLSEGRFTLGPGSGERLNEHVVGRGFPDTVTTRQEKLHAAIEIIELLWHGGYQSYDRTYLRLSDTRVFDLPDTPPGIAVAPGGRARSRLGGRAWGRALRDAGPALNRQAVPRRRRDWASICRGSSRLGTGRRDCSAGRPENLQVSADRVDGHERCRIRRTSSRLRARPNGKHQGKIPAVRIPLSMWRRCNATSTRDSAGS